MTSKVSVEDANSFLACAFERGDGAPAVVLMEDGYAVMRLDVSSEHLRPGGYISGPTQMSLADSVTYMAIFTRLGITPMTVTSNLNMSFLRPCIGKAVIARAKLLKLGRTLAVAEAEILAEGADKVASHAIVTYSIPQEA